MGFLDNAKRKAAEVAEAARHKAGQVADAALGTAAQAGDMARAGSAEAMAFARKKGEEAAEAVLGKTSELTGLEREELDRRLKEAGDRLADGAYVVGDAAATVGKTVSGVNAYRFRKQSKEMHEATSQMVDAVSRENDERNADLRAVLEEFGKVRLEALHEVVGPFLDILDRLGQKNRAKEYELLGVAHIDTENIDRMKQLDMGAGEALRTLAVSGSLGAVALAGTPMAVTAAVGALATASTGTAISTLSGAAASNAVLAWLGGGSIASGGGGIAAGSAVLGGITFAATGVVALAAAGTIGAAFYSKKLTEATEEKAKAEQWAAEVRKGWAVLDGIKCRALELKKLTSELAARAKLELGFLEEIVPVFDSADMRHVKQFQSVALLVKSMTELAQTPMLDEDGNVSSSVVMIQKSVTKLLNNSLKED